MRNSIPQTELHKDRTLLGLRPSIHLLYYRLYPPYQQFNMPVLSLPIPQLPPMYQQEAFTFAKVWDESRTELHQISGAVYQGPPQDVVEMTFAMFLTPREVTLPEKVHVWRILKMIEDGIQRVVTVGPHFQSHHLPPLDPLEANTSDCMCLPFQIRPWETNVAAMHLVNSFMYHDKSTVEAYEDASWAFPVKTDYDTLLTRVHH